MNKLVVNAFDFDGTLTKCDTLLAFIRHACGTPRFLVGFALYAPAIVLMKLHVLDNWRVKQSLFGWFFRGMREEDFHQRCINFAAENRAVLRAEGMKTLREALERGEQVAIVSASIDHWVRPFFEGLDVQVIGTEIETKDGRLTGRFATPNCYGAEKVKRLIALFPQRETYYLKAYGDSRGDKELLAFADEGHMKPFRE